jgi:hypothetical protein
MMRLTDFRQPRTKARGDVPRQSCGKEERKGKMRLTGFRQLRTKTRSAVPRQ